MLHAEHSGTDKVFDDKLLTGLWHPRPDVAAQCAWILGKRRIARAAPVLCQVIKLRLWEIDVAAAAVTALAEIDPSEALSVFQAILSQSATPIRARIVDALQHMTGTESSRMLHQIAHHDPSPSIREQARNILMLKGDASMEPSALTESRLDTVSAQRIQQLMWRIADTIERVIVGKRSVIEQLLVALLANGHVLIEDVPGIGKTKLARTLCQALGGTFRRIQFTPDLLPTDILGTMIYRPQEGLFHFHEGPIFAHVILADEVNRGTPRTQAALLEAMEERQVTIEHQTYPLPQPFLVIATQNPVELEGTFPLPEAQLDRFLLRLHVGYPEREDERAMLERFLRDDPLHEIQPVTTPEELLAASALVHHVHLSTPVEDYLLDLVRQTRTHPDLVLGVSPRGTLALARAAQSYAILQGRPFVLPDDVRTMALPVLAHRVMVASSAELHGKTAEGVIQDIIASLPVPVEPDIESPEA